MADLQSIMQALRNADAAGNTADAQRLAVLAQQAQKTPTADPNAPDTGLMTCLLYTSPSPRDRTRSRMPSSA